MCAVRRCPGCAKYVVMGASPDLTNHLSVYDNLSIVTRSHPSAFPSVLRQKRQLVTNNLSTGDTAKPAEQATIKEKCPGCGHDEMNFHTLQLRSADEGTTVFYDCPKCGYKFSQNN